MADEGAVNGFREQIERIGFATLFEGPVRLNKKKAMLASLNGRMMCET